MILVFVLIEKPIYTLILLHHKREYLVLEKKSIKKFYYL